LAISFFTPLSGNATVTSSSSSRSALDTTTPSPSEGCRTLSPARNRVSLGTARRSRRARPVHSSGRPASIASRRAALRSSYRSRSRSQSSSAQVSRSSSSTFPRCSTPSLGSSMRKRDGGLSSVRLARIDEEVLRERPQLEHVAPALLALVGAVLEVRVVSRQIEDLVDERREVALGDLGAQALHEPAERGERLALALRDRLDPLS